MTNSQYYMYSYSGYKQGVKVQGFLKASSKDELAKRLLKRKIKLLIAKPLYGMEGSVDSKEIVRFSNQMSSMTKNGIPVTEAMQMYAEYAEEDFQFILINVLESLKEGSTLSDSFRKTGFFTGLFCETITMGESSSNLDKSFANIKEFYESEGYIKKKIKGMLIYPSIVMFILLIVTIVMSTIVLPKFGDVYIDMGAKLPFITELYIRFGEFLISSWWLIAIGGFSLFKGFKAYKKGTLNKKNLSRFYLDIPIYGPIYKKVLVTRFSNILSLYLKSGLQIQDSLLSSAKILQNPSVYDEFYRGAQSLLKGKGVFDIVDEISIFPPFFKQVVYTGEKSGSLADSLVKLSKTLDEESKDTLEAASSVMSQAIIIIMFIALAPTIIAILLPVLNITTVAGEAGGL